MVWVRAEGKVGVGWRGGRGGWGGGSARSGAFGRVAIIVAHAILEAQIVSGPRIGANIPIGIRSARHVTVLAVAALVDLVKEGNHGNKNDDRHDDLDDAGDEEQHPGLCFRRVEGIGTSVSTACAGGGIGVCEQCDNRVAACIGLGGGLVY